MMTDDLYGEAALAENEEEGRYKADLQSLIERVEADTTQDFDLEQEVIEAFGFFPSLAGWLDAPSGKPAGPGEPLDSLDDARALPCEGWEWNGLIFANGLWSADVGNGWKRVTGTGHTPQAAIVAAKLRAMVDG